MPGLKDVKDQISGVKKTAQITKAMNMVASAKLRGAQDKMESFRPYAEKFAEAMRDLSSGMEGSDLPLMEVRDVKTVEIVVVTSDRGLCGSFNANIVKAAEKLAKQYEAEGKNVSFVTIGKKAYQVLRRTGNVRASYSDIMSSFQMFNAREISQGITEAFLNGDSDRVDLIYGKFHSVAVQKPETEELLPIKAVEAEGEEAAVENGATGSYIYEPDPNEIMEALLPLHLNVQVYRAMLEVGASEHAARMAAMDKATNACKDIIKELTQLYNKARQAAVTNELMDIVGGAEALKG
ncbi:ATP synthase F1 subunit gamma [Desulfogranum japonicum]|uniref:ATP synthase F1 subunit gamma n=1 Tax=Desulfogranum japonicum TaxID=231447 RepID=UPI0003FDBB7B|nr:ATP synthase F1 subunit gamma [Desulfogranum japonicum]